jgi:hypothetical protein
MTEEEFDDELRRSAFAIAELFSYACSAGWNAALAISHAPTHPSLEEA